MSKQQNKKRKQDDSIGESSFAAISLEQQVFFEMTGVNCALININNKLLKVDYSYMLNHGEMVDEFVGNIHQFLDNLKVLRRRLSFERLNTDTISCIYQFLGTGFILNTCQLVSKIWRDSVNKANLSLTFGKKHDLEKLKSFSFVNSITSLNIEKPTMDSIKSMVKLKRLTRVQSMKLSSLGVKSIDMLCGSKRIRPTSLNLKKLSLKFLGKLFSSKFVSNLQSLHIIDIPMLVKDWMTVEIPSLTYLNVQNPNEWEGQHIFYFMNKCPNLKHAHLNVRFVKDFDNSTDFMFPNLEKLYIDGKVAKSVQLVSPMFPKLNWLELSISNQVETDNAVYESNEFTTPIETLIIYNTLSCVIPITKACRNLKRLYIHDFYCYHDSLDLLSNFNLECLSYIEELKVRSERLFKKVLESPSFVNLKILDYEGTFSIENLFEELEKSPISSLTTIRLLNYREFDQTMNTSKFENLQILPSTAFTQY